ncbi:MAG TPA: EAL domain-containing protein [Acidobacteriaceae bacterium]|jgi:sensor c-di-GMP phosphodiesterase-like protein|nr:EAL domain-containing protein [Acidobacteriaceae bacterium]
MRRTAGVFIAWAIGVAAVLAPVLLSVHLARKQGIESEFALLHGYASDVMRRTEGTGDQTAAAFDRLQRDGLQPCSAAEIDLMRQIAITSSYLQAVGRTRDGQLICSSLGTKDPIPLGPVSYTSATGAVFRTSVRIPLTGGQPVIAIEKGGLASIIDPTLSIDTVTTSADVAVANFSPSARKVITQRGRIHQRWLHTGSGPESEFTDRGILVTVLRSQRFDLATVAAAPLAGIQQRIKEVLLLFVPIGSLCGLALAGAVFYLSRNRFSMPVALRAAARRDEFFIEYQPIVDLESRAWVGAEALVRWRRQGQVVRPDLFIPIAEETGVITLITERVLAHVAADLPAILCASPHFHVDVNLAAADLQSDATLDRIKQLLAASGAPAGNFVVEATERGFLQGQKAKDVVSSIRELGIEVAIDDFGTGYSSLSCLATLNLSYLKIDKSFVDTLGTDGATHQVVQHIIEMAHSLKLKMIAEGVETEEQAEFLTERGVRFGQGWLFGRPMKLEAILSHLAEAKTVETVVGAGG